MRLAIFGHVELIFDLLFSLSLPVADRLAYLNFVHGSISADLAGKLDIARGAWKTARATESTAGTLRQAGQGTDAVNMESEVEKRNALTHGEKARWQAMREVGVIYFSIDRIFSF